MYIQSLELICLLLCCSVDLLPTVKSSGYQSLSLLGKGKASMFAAKHTRLARLLDTPPAPSSLSLRKGRPHLDNVGGRWQKASATEGVTYQDLDHLASMFVSVSPDLRRPELARPARSDSSCPGGVSREKASPVAVRLA
jgi:hypothetical protein